MNDPYQVLGISESATDDEVKRAYRELARKYHPDNYHDNPLADLAQEKMRSTNGAAAGAGPPAPPTPEAGSSPMAPAGLPPFSSRFEPPSRWAILPGRRRF